MRKSSKDIAKCVMKKMKESDKKLGLAKKAYDYVGDEARQALLEHNKRELGEAGGLLGMGAGGLGGALTGAGTGLALRKRLKLPGGRAAGYGALAGALGGGLIGGLAGPAWGESKAEEATARDVDQLNMLAEQQYQQQMAEQAAQQRAAMEQWAQQQQGHQYPHMGKYSAADALKKFAEVDAVPVPEDKSVSVSTPPARNNFFAPHITGDLGHQYHGHERSLQRTPALPREGVTDVVYNR